jgi:hypothetical protein
MEITLQIIFVHSLWDLVCISHLPHISIQTKHMSSKHQLGTYPRPIKASALGGPSHGCAQTPSRLFWHALNSENHWSGLLFLQFGCTLEMLENFNQPHNQPTKTYPWFPIPGITIFEKAFQIILICSKKLLTLSLIGTFFIFSSKVSY